MEQLQTPRVPPSPVDTSKFPTLENRTARRIAIFLRDSSEYIVLPPFGRQPVSPALRERLDLEEWLHRNLVDELPPEVRTEPLPVDVTGLGLLLFLVFLGLPLGVWLERGGVQVDWLEYWIGWGVAVLGLGVLALRRRGEVERWAKGALDLLLRWPEWLLRGMEGLGRALGWLARGIAILLVLAVGFGTPLLIVLSDLQPPQPRTDQLFLLLFVAFVGLVSTLPALLYFLFDQQQMSTVRTRFFRDVMRLDPMIQTLDDAEALYGPLLSEVYGQSRSRLSVNLSGAPILLSTFLMALGWTITLLPTVERPLPPTVLHDFLLPNPTAFNFAFLGAYFFTINMVFRRYVRADLGPKAYSHITKRTIMAVVLAWIAGSLPSLFGGTDAAETAEWVLLMAFFIGIVPETGTAIYHDLLQSQQGWLGKLVPSMRERDPLTRLEGITLYDRARLLEEGIENVENLAHHNLVELMLRTRIPTPRLVDLMDQSLLYLHARGADEGDEAGEAAMPPVLKRLREFGVRTATDFEDALTAARARGQEEQFLALAGAEGEVSRLQVIRDTLEGDDWMPHLRHWRDYRAVYHRIFRLESFYEVPGASAPRAERRLPLPGVHVVAE